MINEKITVEQDDIGRLTVAQSKVYFANEFITLEG